MKQILWRLLNIFAKVRLFGWCMIMTIYLTKKRTWQTIQGTNHTKRKHSGQLKVTKTDLTDVFKTLVQVIQTKFVWLFRGISFTSTKIWCTIWRYVYLQLLKGEIYWQIRPYKDEWFESRPRRLQLLFHRRNSGDSNSFDCFSCLCMLNEVP